MDRSYLGRQSKYFIQNGGGETMKWMEKIKAGTGKLNQLKMDQGWKWLLYLDIIFPFLLFIIALLPISGIRSTFAQFYHNYNLFIICPIPNVQAMIGIVGLILHTGLILRALIRKKWLDLLLCTVFLLAMLAFFGIPIDGIPLNYHVIKLLDFGTPSL